MYLKTSAHIALPAAAMAAAASAAALLPPSGLCGFHGCETHTQTSDARQTLQPVFSISAVTAAADARKLEAESAAAVSSLTKTQSRRLTSL
jgi:hypothetical protein